MGIRVFFPYGILSNQSQYVMSIPRVRTPDPEQTIALSGLESNRGVAYLVKIHVAVETVVGTCRRLLPFPCLGPLALRVP